MSKVKIVDYTNRPTKEGGEMRIKLGCFTHGQLKDEEIKFENVSIYEEKSGTKRKKQIVAAESQNMTYIGKNYGEESYENDFEQTYLGALDPKSGILEIYDVDLFKFKPYFQEMEDEEPDATDSKPSELSYIEQSDQLTQAFGSRKKRKAMENRVRNQVLETTLKKVLDSTVQDGMETAVSTQKKLDDLVKEDAAERYLLPPFNSETTETAEIYKLSDIISDSDMEVLTDPAQEFVQADEDTIKEWTENEKYPDFILDCLKKLPDDEEQRMFRCKTLVYLNYLMTFCRMPTKLIVRSRDPFPPEWPETIRKKLLDLFSDPPAVVPAFDKTSRKLYRSFATYHQQRMICYTMVVALILGNFSLKLTPWIKALSIGQKRIFEAVRLIGCKILNSNNTAQSTAELKAPMIRKPVKRKLVKSRR